MRFILPTTACLAALGIGFSAVRVQSASAHDDHSRATVSDPTSLEHANHTRSDIASMPGFQQAAGIPASDSTAPDRRRRPRGYWIDHTSDGQRDD